MKGTVMEREMPLVAARVRMARRRGELAILRIGALLELEGELELTNDQMKKLLSIRSEMIRTRAKLNGDIRVARLDLLYYTAMNITNVSPDQVRSALKNIYALRLERKAAFVDGFKKAAEILSAEQKDKFKDLVQQRLTEFESDMEAETETQED